MTLNQSEGSGAARLSRLLKSNGKADVELTVATVTKSTPLAIKIDGDPFELTGDELVVAEHLSQYKRNVSLNGGADVEMVVRTPVKVGDKVIVVIAQDGQLYYVLDKAV